MTLADSVMAFFAEDGWDAAVQDGGALLTRVRGEHLAFHTVVVPDEARFRITAYALAPSPVPVAHRLKVLDFATRANAGIGVGNFEVDVSSGELRFKVGLDLHDVDPQPALFRNAIYRAVFALDGTWPGIAAIVDEGASVDEALALVGTLQAARDSVPTLES